MAKQIKKIMWIALFICGVSGLIHAQTYDVTTDFSTTSNPNGVWSYGSMDIGFINYQVSPWHAGWEAWRNNDHSANVWINNSVSHQYGIAPGEVALHPGSGGQPAVIRWTAPDGIGFAQIRLDGTFGAGDQYAPSLAIRQASATLWSGVNSGSFDETTYVAAGDTIDFCVYGESSYANTPLDAVITVLDQQFVEITLNDFDRESPFDAWTTPPDSGGFFVNIEGSPVTNVYIKPDDAPTTWQRTMYRDLPFTASTNMAPVSIRHFAKVDGKSTYGQSLGAPGLRLAEDGVESDKSNEIMEYGILANSAESDVPYLYFDDGTGTRTSIVASIAVDTWIEFRADMDFAYEDASGMYGQLSLFMRENGIGRWIPVDGLQKKEMKITDPSTVTKLCAMANHNPDAGFIPGLDDIRYISSQSGRAGTNTNLLLNSGFADGFGWRTDGEGRSRISGTSSTYDPLHDGPYLYVVDGTTSTAEVWQTVSLLDNGFTTNDIDSGTYQVEFGAWQYGSGGGQVGIDFLDADSLLISSTNLPAYADGSWTEQMRTGPLPSGTRLIRYQFNSGSARIDDAYLALTDPSQNPDVALSVASLYGTPSPAVGTTSNIWGTVVTCSVENVTSGLTNWSCTGWTGTGSVPASGTSNSVEVTLTEDSSITWNWQTNVWLDVNVAGSGAVDVLSGFYTKDSEQILTATPETGWLFMGWSGDASGTNNADVTMDTPKAITATFSDDADGDGLTNTEEESHGSSPWKTDTDGDGFDDAFEVAQGLSPTNDSSAVIDYIQSKDSTFGLYSSNAVLNVAIGEMLMDVVGNEAALNLQLQTSDDLQNWTNAGPAQVWSWTVNGETKFFRVKSSK